MLTSPQQTEVENTEEAGIAIPCLTNHLQIKCLSSALAATFGTTITRYWTVQTLQKSKYKNNNKQ